MSGRTARAGARTVAGQVFLIQVVIIVCLVAAATAALLLQARSAGDRNARDRSRAAAESFAASPGLDEALRADDPTLLLQAHAERARIRSHVDFVDVVSLDGVCYTHPQQACLDGYFTRDLDPGRAGRSVTERVDGSLGPMVQATAPVRDERGHVVGLVSAGVTLEHVGESVRDQLPLLLGVAAGVLALATAGAAVLGRRLSRVTHGLGPAEMARVYEHHDAVLHVVREGVLIVSGGGRVLLANDEARRLLSLPPDVEGSPVADLPVDAPLSTLLASGDTATDEVYEVGSQLLTVSQRPTDRGGGPPGSVTTLRDTTELRAQAYRAETARGRLRLLHDAGSEVGTTLDVARTCRELADFAAARFADRATVDLRPPVLRGQEPADGDTAVERVAQSGPPQAEGAEGAEGVRLAVPLRARGKVLGEAVFWRSGEGAAFEEEDVSLAEELGTRAAVSIDNARRYTRERTMAVTLQESLLPHRLPEADAVEAASRYLPATAGHGPLGGVGGDWFDIIPLPGARVGFVVGDVVGHGLHAAATMGRLRTAVHNFASLDLPPDELLWYLDELVARIDQDERPTGEETAVTGATCVYAVYDPLTGVCSLARAGHLQPVWIHPDGTAEFADVPGGPPLGLGGLPFETQEVRPEPGSGLALYTDGLVEDRHRDIDEGLAMLLAAFSGHPDRTPERTCDDVLAAMLPERPADDVALLVARLGRLGADRSVEWEVEPEPAAVARVRSDAAAVLTEWGLGEEVFTAELILSELVTNAIRYTGRPITVRLIRARCLICEVWDSSLTSPHLRQAATTDEGGRGLFLVAKLSERWGTRYTPRGKVIWAELPLPAEDGDGAPCEKPGGEPDAGGGSGAGGGV
ncbi:SpoIIE family protein phosphatase [Streptomyces polyrhachis]|uniref:SpoIIE family protein phosphatase n=1 Tax=Streptomyces polyrhachis TaxID=1282885 RepID=A0ABW2GL36_9ACTN